MRTAGIAVVLLAGLILSPAAALPGSSRLPVDDLDRSAFQSWFTFLADVQFEQASSDVVDCASLVRHAYREALREHTPEWYRRSHLPQLPAIPDVHQRPTFTGGTLLLFRTARDPDRYGEFADAATIVRLNARFLTRDPRAARPGDLLYFHHDEARVADHLMVFIGDSRFEPSGRHWLVYHTGPDGHSAREGRN